MTVFTALILGIIQGLTEFIPISSTAHLTIAASMLGAVDPNHPERWTAFMATIQLGTLAAVLFYFAADIRNMVMAFFRENVGSGRRPFREQSVDARLAWIVVLGTIPIVVVGLAFKDFIEGAFTKDLTVIGSSLIGVAVLLWLADRRASFRRTTADMNLVDALVIGCAQVFALIPGSSRSGTTILAGLLRGLSRESAARFSFLLSIPAILGAGVLEFLHELKHLSWGQGGIELLVATIASGITGYWSIAFLISYLRRRSMNVFVMYRIALGIIVLLFLTSCSSSSDQRPADVVPEMKAPPTRLTDTTPQPAVVQDTAEITQRVTMITSEGTIVLGLYGKDAPHTVRNFVGLVRRKFYDGILFHRVSKGFIVQAGDPKTRDASVRAEWGRGGQTADGKPLKEELDQVLPSARIGYQPGVLAMARKQAAGTGTSQFFICLEKASVLPYQFTIFGRVLEGMNVVEAIGAVDVEPGPLGETDGIPRKPIVIRSMKLSE